MTRCFHGCDRIVHVRHEQAAAGSHRYDFEIGRPARDGVRVDGFVVVGVATAYDHCASAGPLIHLTHQFFVRIELIW